MEKLNKIFDAIDGLIVVTLFIGYGIDKIRIYFRNKRKKKTLGHLDLNTAIDSAIYPILWDLLGRFGAGRVYIVQFHNGSNFYTGQSIQRKTVSHEVAIRLPKLKMNFDNVLISEMTHKMLREMMFGDYFHVDSIYDLKADEDLSDWMNVYGAQALYHFRLVDKFNNTVATLNMHWNSTNPLKPMDVDYILQAKKAIESIFNKIK